MSEPQPVTRRRSGGRAVVVAAGLLLALPVLYVLSIGPAVWIHQNGNLSADTKAAIETAYAPLEGLANAFEPIEDALDWYVEFWE